LAGLRWWSKIKEDGTEEWIFESLGEGRVVNKVDKWFFWVGLYVGPLTWGILGLLALFSFNINALTVCLVGFCLNGTNLYGYIRCDKDHKNNVKAFAMEKA
jgi:hypothetical protein